ncbi:MAG TPA: TetR/AcrR family transcriptional regulator [Bryobacteraceae bacterium]|nr:TetR/AcrR family transcriptional regulator [Bryobacteraceae bacterium]
MPAPAIATSARRRLLHAALSLFREKGYNDTTVDDLCRAAKVTKGGFFHHFESKQALTLAAIEHWNEVTGALFLAAPYQPVSDPRERLLAYIDFRRELIQGPAREFTCLLGTLVQETFQTHPELREACRAGIENHALTLAATIEQARARHAPNAAWTAESLALHLQCVLQGAFVLAKASNDASAALDSIQHLRRYIEFLLPVQPPKE